MAIRYEPSSTPNITFYKIILSTKMVPALARIPELSRKINRPAISTSFRELRETSSDVLFTSISELMHSTQAHWSTMSFSVERSNSASAEQQAGHFQASLQWPQRQELRVRTQAGLLSPELPQRGRRSASPSSSARSASSAFSSVYNMASPLLGRFGRAPSEEAISFPSSAESID